MAVRQLVTITGEAVYRAEDRVIIGADDPVSPPYRTGQSPGVSFFEIVTDDEE